MKRELNVVTWNLHHGGIDDGNPTRLYRQLDLLHEHEPDVTLIQEAGGWHGNHRRLLHEAAARLGATARFLIEGNYGHHLAMFVKEQEGLRVTGERHDQKGPFWHALGHLELTVGGRTVHVLDAHLAPTNPTQRLIEGETIAGHGRHGDVIAAGDFNACPAAGPLNPPGRITDEMMARGMLDPAPAQAIQTGGFHDIGNTVGNTTPTVGPDVGSPGRPADRWDRIYTTLPPASFVAFKVIDIPSGWSDHRPVIARLLIDTIH